MVNQVEGPFEGLACESTSIRSVFIPLRARSAASELAVFVLPTLPFCEAIEMIMVSYDEGWKSGFSAHFLITQHSKWGDESQQLIKSKPVFIVGGTEYMLKRGGKIRSNEVMRM